MQHLLKGLRKAAATLGGILLAPPASVLACPLCKDAIAGDPVASALSATTLLLIAVPLLLVGLIGGWVSYVYWRAGRVGAGTNDAASPPRGLLLQSVWREKGE